MEINGYKSLNFYRKFQHRNARRNSGGIVVYIKETIFPGINIVRNHYDTIIWLKLNCEYFSIEEDIYLGIVYMWGSSSPAYDVFNCDLFNIL